MSNFFKNKREMDEKYFNCVCPVCSKKFHLKPHSLLRYKNHFCSKECKRRYDSIAMRGAGNHQFGLTGSKNATWKSDEKISNYGYKMIRIPNHPFCNIDGFVFEHRLVAEKYLLNDGNSVEVDNKKYLNPNFVVHHKNFNKLDNRVENLEIMTKGEHSSLHSKLNPRKKDIMGRFI